MKKKRSVVLAILLLSFGINIYLSILNSKSEYRLGENSYKNIQIIKVKNIKNLEILKSVTETSKISNSQLLSLYTNYKTIDEALIDLIGDYSYYKENKILDINNKNVRNLNVLENDVYGRITIYLENILLNILNTDESEYMLKGKNLEDFKVLNRLSEETNNSFNNLSENELKGLEGEERLDEFVDNKYWIDMINQLNKINSNYSDYEFVSKVKELELS